MNFIGPHNHERLRNAVVFDHIRKGKPIGDGSRLESGRAISLESSTLSPSALTTCALGRAAKVPGFQPGEAGSTPAGHFQTFGDVPTVTLPDFEPGDEGSTPSPRAFW